MPDNLSDWVDSIDSSLILDEFDATEDWEQQADEACENLGQWDGPLNELESALDDAAAGIAEFEQTADECLGHLDEQGDSIDEVLLGASRTIAAGWQEQAESLIRDFSQSWTGLESLTERMEALFAVELQRQVDDVASKLETGLKSIMENAVDEVQGVLLDAAGSCNVWVQNELDRLVRYIEDEARSVVSSELQHVGDAVLGRIKKEIGEAMITSQVQVQITTLLSQFLPQLIAAKNLAPVIREALRVARLGISFG